MVRQIRALRVRETVGKALKPGNGSIAPPWFATMGSTPPVQPGIRGWPVNHSTKPDPPSKRLSRRPFKPQRITHEADVLRHQFFSDHPWELARPRVVVEDDGQDYLTEDWSELRQMRRQISGESVVQRQMWLMQADGKSKEEAYDIARREFYQVRHQEDIERRIAKEEALAVGAFFDKSPVEFGMDIEDAAHEDWKAWAEKEITAMSQARSVDVPTAESSVNLDTAREHRPA